MIRDSVFTLFKSYLVNVWRGLQSLFQSAAVVFPYFLGVGENRKVVTEQYPDPVSAKTDDDLPPRTRGLLFNDIEKCTGCGDCVKICPVECITMDAEVSTHPSKKWVSVFDIDMGRCVYCGHCVEVCGPKSLQHTKQYEGAVFGTADLKVMFGKGTVTQELRDKWAAQRDQESRGDFGGRRIY